MPGRDHVETSLFRLAEEQVELHFFVAHHVRVRRATGSILAHHVIHHASAILRLEIKRLERDTERGGHAERSLTLSLPTTAAAAGVRLVGPVLHEGTSYFVALAQQQSRSDRRVDAAAHRDQDFALAFAHNN
jgi:hypothetical protein